MINFESVVLESGFPRRLRNTRPVPSLCVVQDRERPPREWDAVILRHGVVAQIKCEVERDPDETGGMKSTVHPTYKTKYRVRNWASYERA